MNTSISQKLRKNIEIIMKQWEDRARKEVPAAYGTTSLVLQNALQKHLDQLAVALDSSKTKSTAEIAITTSHEERIGKEHGKDRANTSGYSIKEVIFEYRILRQVIIHVLEEDSPISGPEREIITDLIELAVNDAAVQFSDTIRDLKDQYTATLPHDLRGPLTAIKINAQLIARRSDRPNLCLKSATHVIENVNRIDSMIQNLLDAGRIRAGQILPVNTTECDPAVIVSEVLDEMTAVYGERFVFSTRDELSVWWDCDLFRRALENLLSNAAKYGALTSPITVSLQQTDLSVILNVHNEGNPISEKEKSMLFQPYRRLDSAEKNIKEKGWGLGLTLVAGVAKAHGGTISVESSQATGTSFILTLPKDNRAEAHSLT
jgi:signal transduction histidine kinase